MLASKARPSAIGVPEVDMEKVVVFKNAISVIVENFQTNLILHLVKIVRLAKSVLDAGVHQKESAQTVGLAGMRPRLQQTDARYACRVEEGNFGRDVPRPVPARV